MGWTGEFRAGDRVRVTADFEDVIVESLTYHDEVELADSGWAVADCDEYIKLEKVKPRLPVKSGSVIDIVGCGRALLLEDGYWQFTDGNVYTARQVHSLFNFEVALEG